MNESFARARWPIAAIGIVARLMAAPWDLLEGSEHPLRLASLWALYVGLLVNIGLPSGSDVLLAAIVAPVFFLLASMAASMEQQLAAEDDLVANVARTTPSFALDQCWWACHDPDYSLGACASGGTQQLGTPAPTKSGSIFFCALGLRLQGSQARYSK